MARPGFRRVSRKATGQGLSYNPKRAGRAWIPHRRSRNDRPGRQDGCEQDKDRSPANIGPWERGERRDGSRERPHTDVQAELQAKQGLRSARGAALKILSQGPRRATKLAETLATVHTLVLKASLAVGTCGGRLARMSHQADPDSGNMCHLTMPSSDTGSVYEETVCPIRFLAHSGFAPRPIPLEP